MASEIRVNKIENRSGLGTVTFADTGVDLAGIVTATTFSGSGASLTNVPDSALSAVTASKLTGALPAISGANLTGIAATDNVRTGILDVAGVSTFRNTMNVGTAVTISESGLEATGVGITVANINGGKIGGRRNLIINGDFRIAQRGTSSTTSGVGDVDRWQHEHGSHDESPTFAQVSLTTSDTPYTEGLTKAAKITNGNQTSGLQAGSYINFNQNFEAQDMRNSGWNYKSSTNYITLSFWVRTSVEQNYQGFVKTQDGTNYIYSYETGTLTANTWHKIVKTIPGNSNLTINDDTGGGFQVFPIFFAGTNYTSSSATYDTWRTWGSSSRSKDQTATWFTTNDATLELTGVQLEVGPVATPFEHLSHIESLLRCQRFYQLGTSIGCGYGSADGYARGGYIYATQMRSTPTLTLTNSGSGSIVASGASNTGFYVTYGSLGGSSAGIFSYTAASEL